jgi:hypothetical protein
VSDSARDTFIAGIEPRFAPLVLALDAAVMGVRPDFGARISYGLLIYSLPGEQLSHWTCAIGVTSKLVCLRFLYGYLFNDPLGVLRAGTGILRTIDFAPGQDLDVQLVADYVKEAVAKLDDFKAYERDQRRAAMSRR